MRQFGHDLREFLARNELVLDHAFENTTVAVASPGPGSPTATWRLDGIVRGAYRVKRIGGPDPPRHMALVADLALSVDAGDGARAKVTSGAAGLRLDVDRPQVFLDALPPWPDTAEVLRAMADADLRVEAHGPRGRLAVLDPTSRSSIMGILTGEPALRLTPAAVLACMRRPGRRMGVAAAVSAAAVAVAVAVACIRRSR
ncbi:hypothetical protein CFP66_18955 [Pseudonocardia sp. MH-G8]|nr:hypothetical protein CFP66_18955 [Pseudonocardia sp. MH-G8]